MKRDNIDNSLTIIGVMGPGDDVPQHVLDVAELLGQKIAQAGYVLLTGGSNTGIMQAATRGAKAAGGLTIGILKGEDKINMAQGVDIPIVTGLGSARNNINVLTSDVIIACGIGVGTASEISLAIKAGKQVILLQGSEQSNAFFQKLAPMQVKVADDVSQVIKLLSV